MPKQQQITGPADKRFSEAFLTELVVRQQGENGKGGFYADFQIHKRAGWLQVHLNEWVGRTQRLKATSFCLDEPAARALMQQLTTQYGQDPAGSPTMQALAALVSWVDATGVVKNPALAGMDITPLIHAREAIEAVGGFEAIAKASGVLTDQPLDAHQQDCLARDNERRMGC